MVDNGELIDDDFQRGLSKKLSDMEPNIIQFQKYWENNISKLHYSGSQSVPLKPKSKSSFSLFSIFRTNNDDNDREDADSYAFRPSISKSETIQNSITFSPFNTDNKVRGIYIFGNSGTGKTLITTKFFDQLGVQHKLKTHFFEFMDRVHRSNYENAQVNSKERSYGSFI